MQTLINKIVFLVPDAMFSVWEKDLESYMGESEPVERDGYLVDWHASNSAGCPPQESLDELSLKKVEADVEKRRKKIRDGQCKDDLSIKAAYRIAKAADASLKFSEYLDQLEAEKLL